MDYEFDEGHGSAGSARRLIEGIRGWLGGSHPENSKTPGRPLPVKDVARAKPHVDVAIASAVVVILTIIGLVVGFDYASRLGLFMMGWGAIIASVEIVRGAKPLPKRPKSVKSCPRN
jgi:hypothetical protein